MKLKFPDFAVSCLEKIEENGFEAWFVGGCVRDTLLGRPFYDVDIATNARPDDIINIFDKTIPTGIKHGTVTVVTERNNIEVTTYRSEFGYDDGRHPNTVEFKSDISDDLSRRDFTVNAFAYHPARGLLDLFCGIEDLNSRVIRCVGDPKLRFKEDALRILRAFRFASTLGYSIEENTEKAALDLAGSLKLLSGERILAELKKLVCGNFPQVLDNLISNGSFKFCGIYENSALFSNLTKSEPIEEIRLPIFLNICGFNEELLKNVLKIDNKSLSLSMSLKRLSALEVPDSKVSVKKLLSSFSTEEFNLYCEFLKVKDISCEKIAELYCEIEKNNEPYKIKHLAIDGKDLAVRGLIGEEIGKKLDYLLDIVINDPSLNKKEVLLSF